MSVAAGVLLTLAVGCSHGTSPADQRISIALTERGFVPAVVTVRAGSPVTLLVTRQTDRTCAMDFVLKEHGIDEKLPLGRTVAIRFTPERAGRLTYACGMDMVHGTIVVK
jgi:plastocyanin domain-containing protein